MKGKSTTQLPSKSKEKTAVKFPMKSLTQKENEKEKFEEDILNINIKKPRNAFNFFVAEMRKKNKDTGSITDSISKYAEQYGKLTISELKKYQDKADEDKQRYKENMDLVKKYLIDKPLKENATAYSIFIDEKLREARENNAKEDPKEIRKEARLIWASMSSEEKSAYEEKKEQHQKFYEDLKLTNKRVSAYSLYIHDLAKKPENKGKSIADYSEIWKKEKKEVKEKYAIYAQEIVEEREKNRNLYMLAFAIKPKSPKGAFKIFVNEMVKIGKLKNKIYKGARELWEKLSEEEKEIYMKKAQKEKLSYEIIKREYNANNRISRGPSGLNLFMKDLKNDPNNSEYSHDGFLNFAIKKWNNLDSILKQKYEIQSKELKAKLDEEFKKKMKQDKYKPPKRPLSMYNIYVQEKMPELRLEYPDKLHQEIFIILSENFSKLSEKEKKIYLEKSEKSKAEYERLKKEYEDDISRIEKSFFEDKKSDKLVEDKKTKNKTKSDKSLKIEEKSKKAKTKQTNEESEDDNRKAKTGKVRSKTAAKKSKEKTKKRNASDNNRNYKNSKDEYEDEDAETEVKTKRMRKANEEKSKKNKKLIKKDSESEDDSSDFYSEEEEFINNRLNKKKGKNTNIKKEEKEKEEEIPIKVKRGRSGVKVGK